MAAAAGTGRAVSLIAPSGAPVEMTVPEAFGQFRWYGSTRFTGPRMSRQFFLAPAGEHRSIPTHIMPGATQQVTAMRGFDAIVFEARDRSDSALVLAGPQHEATTFFGGPAPDAAGIGSMLSSFRFTDAADGATLVPVSDMLVSQPDVAMIGRSEMATLLVRHVTDVLPTLPDWAGMSLPGGELWRGGRVLNGAAASQAAGTPHEWRFILAGESLAMDLVLLGPESGRAATTMTDDDVVGALGELTGRWAN